MNLRHATRMVVPVLRTPSVARSPTAVTPERGTATNAVELAALNRQDGFPGLARSGAALSANPAGRTGAFPAAGPARVGRPGVDRVAGKGSHQFRSSVRYRAIRSYFFRLAVPVGNVRPARTPVDSLSQTQTIASFLLATAQHVKGV